MILWVFVAIAILLLLGARLFVVVGVTTMLCFILVLGEGMSTSGLVRIANMVEGLTTKNVFLSLPFFVAAGLTSLATDIGPISVPFVLF